MRVLADDRVDWFVFWRFFEGSAMLRTSGRCNCSKQSKLMSKRAGSYLLRMSDRIQLISMDPNRRRVVREEEGGRKRFVPKTKEG